jgi:hypothetical protein
LKEYNFSFHEKLLGQSLMLQVINPVNTCQTFKGRAQRKAAGSWCEWVGKLLVKRKKKERSKLFPRINPSNIIVELMTVLHVAA